MGRLKINDTYYLEGKQFDWELTEVYEREKKGDEGETLYGEKKLYFPRLTQIASFLVCEESKLSGSIKELVDAINNSTQSITTVLMGVEERLSQEGNTRLIQEVAQDEGVSNSADETETKPKKAKRSRAKQPSTAKKTEAPTTTTGRRRRRKKA